jgi:hypothetical protein
MGGLASPIIPFTANATGDHGSLNIAQQKLRQLGNIHRNPSRLIARDGL